MQFSNDLNALHLYLLLSKFDKSSTKLYEKASKVGNRKNFYKRDMQKKTSLTVN